MEQDVRPARGRPALRIQPVVLAGGSSAQLWPLSRAGYPKQLLRVHSERTLLQETLGRVAGLDRRPVPSADGDGAVALLPPLVVCHEEHRYLVLEQIREALAPAGRLLLEPASRGTAPALTIAAHAALDTGGGADPVLLVMPADHVIESLEPWRETVLRGASLAARGRIVAFGVAPDRAETAFGYLRQGAADGEGFALEAFAEKPSPDAARSYLSAGRHLWNSGMYVVQASVWLDAVTLADERIAARCEAAYRGGAPDGCFYRVEAEPFRQCPANSIDYAVMEPVAGARAGCGGGEGWRTRDGRRISAAVVPLDAGWSDVGAWPSLLEFSRDDEQGNVLRGDVLAVDTTDSVLISTRRLLAAVGVDDLIAVETADAVLVVHRDRSHEVPRLVERLHRQNRAEADNHVRVYRPWGDYESLDVGERYQVKRLTVKPGEVLSLQMHHHRAEHWVVVRGTAKVTRGEEVFLLTENESTYIPVGMKHRLENPGSVPLEIIEVQSGSYLGEDDIVRFEDRYDRVRPG